MKNLIFVFLFILFLASVSALDFSTGDNIRVHARGGDLEFFSGIGYPNSDYTNSLHINGKIGDFNSVNGKYNFERINGRISIMIRSDNGLIKRDVIILSNSSQNSIYRNIAFPEITFMQFEGVADSNKKLIIFVRYNETSGTVDTLGFPLHGEGYYIKYMPAKLIVR